MNEYAKFYWGLRVHTTFAKNEIHVALNGLLIHTDGTINCLCNSITHNLLGYGVCVKMYIDRSCDDNDITKKGVSDFRVKTLFRMHYFAKKKKKQEIYVTFLFEIISFYRFLTLQRCWKSIHN